MRNLVQDTKSALFRPNLEDEVIGQNVRRKYEKVLDICANKAIRDGEGWRSESNPVGCASNAQLWILGNCLGHASTAETDEDLRKCIEKKRHEQETQ